MSICTLLLLKPWLLVFVLDFVASAQPHDKTEIKPCKAFRKHPTDVHRGGALLAIKKSLAGNIQLTNTFEEM